MVAQSGAFWLDHPPQTSPEDIASQLPFSEKPYLARYPNVAAAVQNGNFPNGKGHYDHFGKKEGRLPACDGLPSAWPTHQLRNHPVQCVQLLARYFAALEEMPEITYHAGALLLIA